MQWWEVPPRRAIQVMFVLYAGIGLASGLIYRRIDDSRPAHDGERIAPLGPSRGIVYRLAALFSIDAFSGGLIVQTMLASSLCLVAIPFMSSLPIVMALLLLRSLAGHSRGVTTAMTPRSRAVSRRRSAR